LWLVTRATRPLTIFARAADQLGKNIRSDPLPEKGPTEVLEASRALNNMQERLRRLIENRTQMLAAISHDLRTPLTLLRLQAELLVDSNAQAKVLCRISELEAMIASILDFAKETFSDEPQRIVDLAALVESVCDDLADTGAMATFSPSHRVLYSCRRMALKRAISNVVDNAVKYGKVANVKLVEDASAIRIVIDDKGLGLPDAQLEQVFVPFYRGDASRSRHTGGAGLGLSIAQAIVHGHGGTITLSNRSEGGLRVKVLLPR
jgi:signal transduction histidine kinase